MPVTRYFTRPRSSWLDNDPLLPSLDVPDHEPVCTGLLDQHGDPIWRGPNAIGFHNPRERG